MPAGHGKEMGFSYAVDNWHSQMQPRNTDLAPKDAPSPLLCRSLQRSDCTAWGWGEVSPCLDNLLCWSAPASGDISALSSALFPASSPASFAWEGGRFAGLRVSL